MDKLWYFSETGHIFWVQRADSIVNEDGIPIANMAEFEVKIKDAAEFATFCDRSDQIILVSSLQEFAADYLRVIPVSMPRVALIKSGTPVPVREQLDKLELDAYLLGPFDTATVNATLERSLDDKNSLVVLQEELKNYSSIAFTAMSSASEMGIVAFYAQSVQNIADMDRLAQQTLRCLNDLSVQGFIQFSFEDGVHVYPDNISKSYCDILDSTRTSEHRIVSHGRFLIFNFENAQFLITDAPVEDPDKCGRLRDVIAHIVSIAEARAKTIKVNGLLKEQQENTRTVMMLLEMASRDNRTSVKNIMTDLSMALREIAMGLDLNLEQETAMLALSERALESLECLHEATDAVEIHFRSLLLQLDQAAKLLKTDEVAEPAEIESSVELF
ncbi:MAG: hypothetical protein U5M23_13120 [Marinagarivorans sp.]|nr:hypothetical protein [Marinagarivorans sp.]